MPRHERSAPIWLFSFVDLAFLLLIAFTQIGPEPGAAGPPLGELEIPRIHSAARPLSGAPEAAVWQLRVHPRSDDDESSRRPFELVSPEAPNPKDASSTASTADGDPGAIRVARLDAGELASRLALLRTRAMARPLLAPHRDSRSEDLLVAVGLLEATWQGGRSVAVLPGPAVSAPPLSPPDSAHDTER